MLQDVSSDVFVSMRGAESMVLGVATTDGAASMVDTAIGAVCCMSRCLTHLPSHSLKPGVQFSAALFVPLSVTAGQILCRDRRSNVLTVAFHMQLRCNRYLAAARCKLWWMTPEWGSGAADLTPETQFLLLELKEGGPYAIMLPLIDRDTFRGTLRPPGCAFVHSKARARARFGKRGDVQTHRPGFRLLGGGCSVMGQLQWAASEPLLGFAHWEGSWDSATSTVLRIRWAPSISALGLLVEVVHGQVCCERCNAFEAAQEGGSLCLQPLLCVAVGHQHHLPVRCQLEQQLSASIAVLRSICTRSAALHLLFQRVRVGPSTAIIVAHFMAGRLAYLRGQPEGSGDDASARSGGCLRCEVHAVAEEHVAGLTQVINLSLEHLLQPLLALLHLSHLRWRAASVGHWESMVRCGGEGRWGLRSSVAQEQEEGKVCLNPRS